MAGEAQAREHVHQPRTDYNPTHQDEPWSDSSEAGARVATGLPSGRSKLTYADSVRGATMSLSGPARVLVMVDQPLIVDVIKLTLNHGVYVTREARDEGL